MAETDREDRTLPPTARRLEKAREEGQVARSRELAGLLVTGTAFAAIGLGGSAVLMGAGQLLRAGLAFDGAVARTPTAALDRMGDLFGSAALVFGPLLLALLVAAVAAPLALGGWVFTWKPVMPAFHRIDPFAGLGRLVSLDAWAELGKSSLKAVAIAGVAAWSLHESAGALATSGAADPAAGLAVAGHVLGQGALLLLLVLAVLAAIDVPLALFRHHRGLRMTLQEMKEEHRESEGDPQLKARVRATQRAIARRRMMAAVPTATVVVTNPTHYAVAITWREGQAAPRVVAKGAGEVAQRIKEVAREAGVPLLEAPPLARALHRHVEIEREIPPALYQAVAQVLAWVFGVQRAQRTREREPAMPVVDVPVDLDPGPDAVPGDDADSGGRP